MPSMLRWLILPCCLSLFAACNDNEETYPQKEEIGRRTVLMYVSAQNSLGYKNFHDRDSIEIVKGRKFIDDKDRLLVYVDDERNPRIYRYTRSSDKAELVRKWDGEINSSSPQALEDVLYWTKKTYPSEEYGLVMWSHSDGWIPSTNKNYVEPKPKMQPFSFGIDVGSDGSMKTDRDNDSNVGAQMDITDMAAAIQKSGIDLKYIFFDSCLMQNIECCYTLRNVTDYIIAAPMQIPGCGANYTHLLEKGLFTDAENDIAEVYATDAQNGFDDIHDEYYDFGLVISTIRTDKMEALAATTADVLSRSSLMGKQSPDMGNTLNYHTYTYTYFLRPHFYDAQEAMRKVLNEKDFALYEKALNQALVNKATTKKFWIGPGYNDMKEVDDQHFSGISTFIPQDVYTENAKDCIYGDLNKDFQATEWYHAAGWANTGW